MSDAYLFRRNGKFISGYSIKSGSGNEVINVVADNPKQAEILMRYLPLLDQPEDFSSDDIDYVGQHDF